MALADTARLIAELELRDKFSGPALRITSSLGRMERGFGQIGRGVGQVGAGLDRLGTRAALAAAGGLAAVITKAASFEQAFVGITKTVDETATTSFADLNEALREMARTIPVAFEELAGIGEAGGALGIAADDLEAFIDVVARLAVSTNLSSETAATALGQLGNILHLEGAEFEDFADSLVALGNAGASTEAEIVDIAARFAAAGNAAGLTTEEILALASATASMGINVEAAGSSLSRIFNSVATNIGTSSEKAVAFADTLSLSAAEFREAWERDAVGTFQDFLVELGKLDQFEQADLLKKIGITGVRDVNAVKLMAQNIGLVNEQLAISEEATGELRAESQKFFDTTSSQWKVTLQNVQDVAATIGAELLPIVNDLTKEFVDFLQLDTSQGGIKQFAKDLAGGIRGVVDTLKGTDFSGLVEGMKIAGQVASTAFGMFRSLPPGIQALAISAIALNKVSGGAVGQIAGGLAGIVGGVIKVAFPKLDIFTRGSSPANPLFVSAIGGVGGPGGAAGRGGGGAAAGFLGLGSALAVIQGGMMSIEDIESGTRDGVIDGMLSQGVIGLITNAVEGPVKELLGVEEGNTDTLAGKLDSFTTTGKLGLVNDNLLLDEARHSRAETVAGQQMVSDRVQAMRDTMAERLATLDAGVRGGLGGIGGQMAGLLAKESSFTANITTQLSVNVNASLVAEQVRQQQISVGFGSGHGGPIPIP